MNPEKVSAIDTNCKCLEKSKKSCREARDIKVV